MEIADVMEIYTAIGLIYMNIYLFIYVYFDLDDFVVLICISIYDSVLSRMLNEVRYHMQLVKYGRERKTLWDCHIEHCHDQFAKNKKNKKTLILNNMPF